MLLKPCLAWETEYRRALAQAKAVAFQFRRKGTGERARVMLLCARCVLDWPEEHAAKLT